VVWNGERGLDSINYDGRQIKASSLGRYAQAFRHSYSIPG